VLARLAPAAAQPSPGLRQYLSRTSLPQTLDDSGVLGLESVQGQMPLPRPARLPHDHLEDTAVRSDGSWVVSVWDNFKPGWLLAFDPQGQLLWRVHSETVLDNKLIPLPAMAVLSGSNEGLECFAASGRLLWRVRPSEHLDFDGYTFGVSAEGVIATRIASGIYFWHADGQPAANAVELGTRLPWLSYDWRGLLVGSDGKFYVQLRPPLRISDSREANWVIAFNADGSPLWRSEFPQNDFDLAAAGPAGELYGLRIMYGQGLSSQGARECEVVCIQTDL